MSALADEAPAGDAIALVRLRLHATEADAGAWSRALLEAWKGRPERSLFILENADAVSDNPDVLALLGDMLACRPPERAILVSSREHLPLRVGHYLAPHQVLTLMRDELRFDSDETAAMFEGIDLPRHLADRIVRLADGWPIALALLARFVHYEAHIEALLDRLEDVPYERRYENLGNEVLAALTPAMMSVLIAAAAIPHASLEDLSTATGIRNAMPIVEGLLRLPEFIASEAGAYHTHPLLVASLRARHESDFAAYLLRAARENDRHGNLLRAAELYHVCGDDEAAAAALDRLPAAMLERPSPRVIAALTEIAMPTLCAHPNLWIATLDYRRQNVAASRLYAEATRLLQSVDVAALPSLHRRLRVRLAMFAQELDKLAEARTLMEAGEPSGSYEEAPEEQRLALMTSALVAAKQGRFSEADRFVEGSEAVQGVRYVRFDAERALIAAERARFRGDWEGLLKMGDEALHAAQRSGVTARIAAAARAVAQAAWYCNDDARATAAHQILEDCGDGEVRAFARLVEAALAGEPLDGPARMLPIARWHAALATSDLERAKALFDRAIDESDALESGFLRVMIRVCAALLLPTQRRRLVECRMIAQQIESPPLQASLELLIESAQPAGYGSFKHMAARVTRSPLKVRQDVLCVDLIRGDVRRGTELLHVSDRGLELLAALALFQAGTPKEELAAAIWPGIDGEAQLNALKMCVSRTRAQVGDKEAILSTKRGYTLSDRVAIDVRELERLLRSARSADGFGETTRRRLEEAVSELEAPPAYTADWTWFAPYAARLIALHKEMQVLLARDGTSIVAQRSLVKLAD